MIYVTLEGGLVTSVATDAAAQVGKPVVVIDYGTEGVADEDITPVLQSDGTVEEAFVHYDQVEKVEVRIMEKRV